MGYRQRQCVQIRIVIIVIVQYSVAINELNWTIEESNRKGTNQHAGTLGDDKRFFSTLIIELKNLWDKLDRMMCRLGQI